jgi:O-antigen ligase
MHRTVLDRKVHIGCLLYYNQPGKTTGIGFRSMEKIRRFFDRESILWVALIAGAVLFSLIISLSFLESNKTVFRICKSLIFLQFLFLIIFRLRHFRPLSCELFILLYPLSAAVAAFYNFWSAVRVHIAYTLDGPILFCIALFGMISFMLLAKKRFANFTRTGLLLFFIAGAAVMSVSSIGGFIRMVLSDGCGSSLYTITAGIIHQDNWNGVLTNPNAIATFFLMGIVANGLFFVVNRDRLSRRMMLTLHALTVVFFVNALLTQCRGVVLSAVVFAFVLVVWYYYGEIKGRRLTRKRIIFVSSVIIASLIAVLILELRFGIASTLLAKTLLSKSSFRLEFWTGFIDFNIDHFSLKTIVGYGFQPSTHHYNTINPYYGMHNFFFEIWARYGLLAVITICAGIGRTVYVYVKKSGFDAYVFSLAAILMHNLFEDYVFFHIHLLTSLFFIYVLSVMIVRAYSLGDQNER